MLKPILSLFRPRILAPVFILVFAAPMYIVSQETTSKTTITRSDGHTVTGRLISQDSSYLIIESDGMTISIPTSSITNVAYNVGSPSSVSTEEYLAKEEVLRSLRRLVVANDTGVSLVNFGPMLIQAKADTVEPLRKIDPSSDFAIAINQSLIAYQHAFEAWQIKIKTEYIFASDNYGKWAIATYNVKKRGLLKTVWLEDVRQAALSRASNYFQKAEALAKKVEPSSSSELSTKPNESRLKDRKTLVGRWITEITTPDGKLETFNIEISSEAGFGRIFGFGGQTSAIESITEDTSSQGTFVIVTVPEKVNGKREQIIVRVRLRTDDQLNGTLHLRRLSDNSTSAEATISAIRVRN